MKERWKDWTSCGYPVAIFVEEGLQDRYLAQLVDLQGCMMQGSTIGDVLCKMDEIVPCFISTLQKHGVTVPLPSEPHGFSCQSIEWTT